MQPPIRFNHFYVNETVSFKSKEDDAGTPDLPIIDFEAWSKSGSYEERLKVAYELVDACHNTGFVYIKNHGVPAALLTEAFAWSKKFFDLDEGKKAEAARNPDGLSFRGWVKVGGEALPPVQEEKVKGVVDYNENYGMGSEKNTHDPNIWISDSTLPRFQSFMKSFYPACWNTAQFVLRALAIGLELPDEDYLLKYHDEADSDLTIRHYPPVNESKVRSGEMDRLGAHSDFDSLTLLFQDSFGGLKIKLPKTGQWIDAPPIDGALVMNIGDVLSRWSNDYLTSTVHRVHLPTNDLSYQGEGIDRITRSRYSIPFFVVPKDDVIMECLNFPAIQGQKAKYEPITWGEFVRMKTLEIYPNGH